LHTSHGELKVLEFPYISNSETSLTHHQIEIFCEAVPKAAEVMPRASESQTSGRIGSEQKSCHRISSHYVHPTTLMAVFFTATSKVLWSKREIQLALEKAAKACGETPLLTR
jgi:hypothetical protein